MGCQRSNCGCWGCQTQYVAERIAHRRVGDVEIVDMKKVGIMYAVLTPYFVDAIKNTVFGYQLSGLREKHAFNMEHVSGVYGAFRGLVRLNNSIRRYRGQPVRFFRLQKEVKEIFLQAGFDPADMFDDEATALASFSETRSSEKQ